MIKSKYKLSLIIHNSKVIVVIVVDRLVDRLLRGSLIYYNIILIRDRLNLKVLLACLVGRVA